MKKNTTIEVTLDLGDLKPIIQREARRSGVSVNEFICNALESKVRRERDRTGDSYVRHGGKHLMGKHTGYEVTEDGRYYPAPSWAGQFEELFAQRNAITNLANAIFQQAQERLVDIEKAILKTMNRLVDDLGLDSQKNWVYYAERGYLQERKEKPAKTETENER